MFIIGTGSTFASGPPRYLKSGRPSWFAAARAARHDGAAGRTAGERHYGFDSWITAGIDDLAAVDSDDLRHNNKCSPFEVSAQHIEHWCEPQASEIFDSQKAGRLVYSPKVL